MEESFEIQDEIKLRLTPMAENYLLTATRWAKFLGILGFVYAGLILLLSFFIGTLFSIAAATSSIGMQGFPAAILSFVYIVASAIVFISSLFMYNFANKTQRGIKLREEYSIEAGMKAMKNYYLLTGVLAIVALSFFLLFLFISIIAGVVSAF